MWVQVPLAPPLKERKLLFCFSLAGCIIGYMKKKDARKWGLYQRTLLSEEERRIRSHKIFEQLISALNSASVIGCYVSFREEVDTLEILRYCLERKKTVCVPKMTGTTLAFYEMHSLQDLREGRFHILEPCFGKEVQVEEIDLMIVPVVAYDRHGNRCGYGRGYYDSVLKRCRKKIGIAFKEQQVDSIEKEKTDVTLNAVLSE